MTPLEALARAYDREDAAQRGEPDPWSVEPRDPSWEAERLACAHSGFEAYLATQQTNAPELVERLRKRADQSGLLLSDPPKPSPDAAMFSEAADALTAAHAQIAELKKQNEAKDKALEPFATLADDWVNDDGWTDLSCQNDRICDWFGPSDFRAARAAMGGGE